MIIKVRFLETYEQQTTPKIVSRVLFTNTSDCFQNDEDDNHSASRARFLPSSTICRPSQAQPQSATTRSTACMNTVTQ